MKHLLNEGYVSLLIPKGNGGALSGEVHLIRYKGKKYVVRRCKTLEKARFYENISKKLEKYGFLPKFLGRHGKDVFYEYIDGRDARHKENLNVFGQIGKIAAHINRVKARGGMNLRFKKQLKELVTGNFAYNKKAMTRILRRIKLPNWKKPRAIFDEKYAHEIMNVYSYLRKEANYITTLDANDISHSNFRISKGGKVYFVDIEAIKPRIRGFGIAKFFWQWGKDEKYRNAFRKGYTSAYGSWFFTGKYEDLCFLLYLMQRINYNVNTYQDKGYDKELRKLNEIVDRYKLR